MISKEYLRTLCPVTIKELCSICNQSSKAICLGWLRDFLRTGEFVLNNGLIRYTGE